MNTAVAVLNFGEFESEHLTAFLDSIGENVESLVAVIPDSLYLDIHDKNILLRKVKKESLSDRPTSIARYLSEAFIFSPSTEKIIVLAKNSKLPSVKDTMAILRSELDFARFSNCTYLSRNYADYLVKTQVPPSWDDARKHGFRTFSLISRIFRNPREVIDEVTFVRFAMVGASGIVVNELVLTIFKFLITSVSLVIGNIFAVELSIISNFLLNDKFTFRASKEMGSQSKFLRLLKYNLVSVVSAIVNLLVFSYLYSFAGVFYIWSSLIAIAVAFLVNYFGSSRWAWRGLMNAEGIPARNRGVNT